MAKSRAGVVVPVPDLPGPKPYEDLVLALEALLAEARSGNLRGITWVGAYSNGVINHGWRVSTGINKDQLIGRMVASQHLLTAHFHDPHG